MPGCGKMDLLYTSPLPMPGDEDPLDPLEAWLATDGRTRLFQGSQRSEGHLSESDLFLDM